MSDTNTVNTDQVEAQTMQDLVTITPENYGDMPESVRVLVCAYQDCFDKMTDQKRANPTRFINTHVALNTPAQLLEYVYQDEIEARAGELESIAQQLNELGYRAAGDFRPVCSGVPRS